MEVRDIFELRKQGRIEEAYEAIRPMYAVHKGKYTTLCMFWTANDILKKRLLEQRYDEARKIFEALLRVLPNIDDRDGRAHAALVYDALRLSEDVLGWRMLDFVERQGTAWLTEADWAAPPQPPLAWRILERAFREISQQPTVDNALKVMPLLTEALRRQPGNPQGANYKRIIQHIIDEAEKAAETEIAQKAEKTEKPQPNGHNKQFGNWGEELAADYLERKGYRILERDWRSGHRDIDIVARNVDTVVFVEVKTRRTSDFGEPYEAVNYRKRRNLLHSINHYLRYKHIDLRPRFDIISIVAPDTANPQIQHIEDVRLM